MSSGKLVVYLENATGLDDTNWLTDMNPYVVFTYGTEQKKSSTASGEGSSPEWNESFYFTSGSDELHIKLMDENTFQSDDFIGETTISLVEVFNEGEVGSTSYELYKDDENCGSIRLGLSFTHEERSEYDEDY
ncbi:elicitor-responsive protein 3-like [Lycium barbarum]|uniref:elicitor-responsive protein 3-like n=1 Tax=Lycium barbarum TaxID=112863 RepID=UPI00293F5F98|nr:elicitor-responsive protein 3-like [Lycium barbarum]